MCGLEYGVPVMHLSSSTKKPHAKGATLHCCTSTVLVGMDRLWRHAEEGRPSC